MYSIELVFFCSLQYSITRKWFFFSYLLFLHTPSFFFYLSLLLIRKVYKIEMLLMNIVKRVLIRSKDMCTCQWDNRRDTNLNCKFYFPLFVMTIMLENVLIIMWVWIDVGFLWMVIRSKYYPYSVFFWREKKVFVEDCLDEKQKNKLDILTVLILLFIGFIIRFN
jgi:hypothetical protein